MWCGRQGNTNVLQLFRRIDYDPDRQLTYYDPGVGTFSAAGASTPFAQWFSRLLGQAFGAGLRTNLEEAYTFLMNHWNPGDEIYIFGFSRGAYTARAMAGLLCRIGIIRPGGENLVRYAVSTYARRHSKWTDDDWKQAGQYKNAFGRMVDGKYEVPVTYLGVWDTVKAPGLLRRSMTWPDTRVLKNVAAGRHAVSIDEKRRPFREYLVDAKAADRIDEVWFAGVHSDVGGSFTDPPALGDITLNWIAEGAKKAGLEFRSDRPLPVVTPAHATGPIHKMGWIWVLLINRLRPIPLGAKVHASVRSRIEQQADYARKHRLTDMEWVEPDWAG